MTDAPDDPKASLNDRIVADLRAGMSLREIAARHHVSKSTISALKKGARLGEAGAMDSDPVGRALLKARLRALALIKSAFPRDALMAEELLAVLGEADVEELEVETQALEERADRGRAVVDARDLKRQLEADALRAEQRLSRAHLEVAALAAEHRALQTALGGLKAWWAWWVSPAGRALAVATATAEARVAGARAAAQEAESRVKDARGRLRDLEEARARVEARLARASTALRETGLVAEHLDRLAAAGWSLAEVAEIATLAHLHGISPDDARTLLKTVLTPSDAGSAAGGA